MKKIISLLVLAAVLLSVSSCKRASELDTEGVPTGGADTACEQQNVNGETNPDTDALTVNDNEPDSNDTVSDAAERNKDSAGNVTDSAKIVDGMIVDSKLSSYIDYSADELEDKASVIMICRYDGQEVQVLPDETAPASYAGESFIDRYVTPLKVAKGSVTDSVAIRTRGGVRDNIIYSSDEITLEKGRSYFIYLKEGTSVRENDNPHYKMISGGTQGCALILDDGTLDKTYIDPDDADEITRLYNSIK